MTAKRYWADLTAVEFRALDVSRTIAVLPVGAIEQHGPHLPVSVDRDIVEEIVARAAPRLDDLPVLFLPTMPIGKSNEHIAFPGTLTLSAETLMRVWMEIGASVARAGVRKLVIFNGHGGNTAVMDIVARDLRARHGMLTASCSWYGLFDSSDLFDKRELAHGIHAGEGETSVMLAARGHLVDMSLARDFTSRSEQWARDHDYLGAGSTPVKLGWLIQDLNRDGACGNAAGADAEKGERLLDRGVEHFIAMLREIDGMSADDLDAFPT